MSILGALIIVCFNDTQIGTYVVDRSVGSLAKRKFLGEILLQGGFVTEEELADVLRQQEGTGTRLGDILIERGILTPQELMRVLENQQNVPYVDLDRTTPDPAMTRYIPIALAKRHTLAPVRVENNVLYVAIEDPKNFPALDDARNAARMDIQPMLARGRNILSFIDKIYGNQFTERALSDFSREYSLEEAASNLVALESSDVDNAPIVRLINALLEQAVGMGASDIHVEPTPEELRVRMRVDGVLAQALKAPKTATNPIIARLKILSNLNIAEKRVPQDGRFESVIMGHDIDVRLSILPTVHGEKAVMRLLDRSNFLKPKSVLGFTEDNLKKFDSLLQTPHGIILVTGPTGSGKSTTLYTMLSEINDVKDNIVTVEDPVEYMISGLNQVQVNVKAGMDFASGLRSILRQDPDIIMIGEIRDAETVEIAIRAAITGHLVLSTIHTNDAVSTIFRLVDMGVPSYMVAASLVGVISQRLVRTICPNCRQPHTPSAAELEMAGISPEEAETKTFYKGAGCSTCGESGYKGRIAVHEVLIVDHGFRDLVHQNVPVSEMYEYALKKGMVSLRESAMKVVDSGRTTLQELADITHGT